MICSRFVIFVFLSVFVTIQVTANEQFSVLDAIRNAFLSKDEDINCNSKLACPGKSSCCKSNIPGSFNCCDFPNATCCSDALTCCPSGYRCSVEKRMCYAKNSDKNGVSAKELRSLSGSSVSLSSDVTCPDGISNCPDGNTCCKLTSGQYGCCPFPKAVCCSDRVHCCPNDFTCSAGGYCSKGGVLIKALRKTASKRLGDVTCPDHTSSCPDGTTCCKVESGQFGCCPYPKATCCSDKVHCCPNGYSCGNGTCIQKGLTVKAVRKMVAIGLGDVTCPDHTSSCPDGTTCCKVESGQFGCCPYPKATCCSDKVHCCPNGYSCGNGTCIQKGLTVKAVRKMAAIGLGDVTCPDHTSSCPDGTTCCKVESGQFGCCPYPKATCCSDKVHCCPNGYSCGNGTCIQKGLTVKAVRKMAAVGLGDVTCPDHTSSCPDGTTCCKVESGQFGCCPYPKATCCSDKVHCCPNGYSCGNGTCNQKGLTVKAANKMAAIGVVSFPDQSLCPDHTTCCKMLSGQYGCCPIPKAVCCSDGLHCCPNGYTCDVSQETCLRGTSTIKASTKVAAIGNVICSDKKTTCPDGSTCCKLSTGQYGCCPYPKAMCCNDGVHCCPNGYTCNVAQGTCSQGGLTVKAFSKVAALENVIPLTIIPARPDVHQTEKMLFMRGKE